MKTYKALKVLLVLSLLLPTLLVGGPAPTLSASEAPRRVMGSGDVQALPGPKASPDHAVADTLFDDGAVITGTVDGPTSVYAVDLDKDGDVDVLTASEYDDAVAWYENDGASPPAFTQHEIATDADGARSVYAADVDGDGDLDVLAASQLDDTVAWYENDGASPPAFTRHEIATDADGARSVYAADLDSDGDMDVLSASSDDDTIAWYENDGVSPPAFTPHEIATDADSARSVYAADLDRDGDLDVLSASANDNKIAWYENDGASSPGFTMHEIATDADGAHLVYVADLNRDGNLDVISASSDDDTIAWYESDGAFPLTFTPHEISTDADGAVAVYVMDLDNDGDPDVLSASSLDDKIAWYENDEASFTERVITTAAEGARSVYAADLDDDGDPDVLSASARDDKLAWYDNLLEHPISSFPSQASVASAVEVPRSIHAADLDGDGDEDVLSASYGDDRIAWHENDDASFTSHDISTGARGASSVYAADLDHDGDLDVLSASYWDNEIAWHENDGTASFVSHAITDSVQGAYAVFAADVDGDGDTDVLSASSGDHKIAWYENEIVSDTCEFTSHVIADDALYARSVYAADMDGDGDIDVLSASYADHKIAWYENNGDGSDFTAHVITTNARGANSVYAADVDGDGDMDALSTSAWDHKTAWYENNGDGTFTDHPIDTVGDVSAVHAADVDRDGDMDILVTLANDDDGNGEVIWYENTAGDGSTFTPNPITTDADGASAVFVADVDGDGNMDVLSASVYDSRIAWHDNGAQAASALKAEALGSENSETQLAAPAPLAAAAAGDLFEFAGLIDDTAESAKSVYAADVDGDGDMDVISASADDNTIAWYENDGSDPPGFTAHEISTEAEGAQSVYAADVDGDGDVDVLAASYRDDEIAWYENTMGDGSVFSEHIVSNAVNGPLSVYAGDMDNDGDVDLLSASYRDNKIAWYESDGTSPPAFTQHVISDTLDSARAVHAADVDGDGYLDVLAVASSSAPTARSALSVQGELSDKVVWYKNDGGTFTAHEVDPDADGARAVYATDVDGDGDVDILAAVSREDQIAWYENTAGDGSSFTEYTVNTTIAEDPRAVYAVDLDGDGDVDVLSASSRDDKIAWYESDGASPPTFTPYTIATEVDGASWVYAVDLDGKGDLDVLSAAEYDNEIAWYENQVKFPFPYYPEQTIITDAAAGACSVYAADVDRDGDADLFSAAEYGNEIAWYENEDSSFTAQSIATGVRGARAVYAADVDGDGDIDGLAASYWDDEIIWYENDGAAFTAHVITDSVQGTYAVHAADVDGDGDMDVLSASSGDHKIAWYENEVVSDTREFKSHTITTDARGARAVYAADVDGDGDMDVLAASYLKHEIIWYENGAGFAAHSVSGDTAWGANSVHAADVDGDGDLDVLSTSEWDDSVTWYENTNGDGSAFTNHNIDVIDGLSSVRASDLDRDGDVDVLVTLSNSGEVVWYENEDGDGSDFTDHNVTADKKGTYGAASIHVADVDRDGDIDIFSASMYDSKIAWYGNMPMDRFEVDVEPSEIDVMPGDSAVYTITVEAQGEFSAPVELSVRIVSPDDIEYELGDEILTPTAETLLTVKTTEETPERTYEITVQGVSEGMTDTAEADLRVGDVPPHKPAWRDPVSRIVVTPTMTLPFRWEPASTGGTPTKYELRLTSPGPVTPTETVVNTETLTVPYWSTTLTPTGEHTWELRACNDYGCSDWDAERTIVVSETLPAPGVPILREPENGYETTDPDIAFKWQAGPGGLPSDYTLLLDGSPVEDAQHIPDISHSTSLEVGEYEWRVVAYNTALEPGRSATRAFTIKESNKVYLPLVVRNF